MYSKTRKYVTEAKDLKKEEDEEEEEIILKLIQIAEWKENIVLISCKKKSIFGKITHIFLSDTVNILLSFDNFFTVSFTGGNENVSVICKHESFGAISDIVPKMFDRLPTHIRISLSNYVTPTVVLEHLQIEYHYEWKGWTWTWNFWRIFVFLSLSLSLFSSLSPTLLYNLHDNWKTWRWLDHRSLICDYTAVEVKDIYLLVYWSCWKSSDLRQGWWCIVHASSLTTCWVKFVRSL